MARQGRAKTAIACSAMASALGSSVGLLLFVASVPVIRHIILAVGPLELALISVWALATLALVVRGSMLKGFALAGLGLALSFIGFDPRTAEARYTLGTLYLRDGVPLVPVFLGLYGIAEALDLAVSGRPTISGKRTVDELAGSVRDGIRAVFRHFGIFIQSSVIGTLVGALPGVGGTVASFAAYGAAVQTVGPSRGTFGSGDIRGVLAPEAAHDAKDGGSLLPTLAFGVPGSAGTAMLLTVLIVHGIAPGRSLMSDRLDLAFVLVWSLFLSNWMTSVVGVAVAGHLARLTIVRTQLLIPVIYVLVVTSAFAYRSRFGDVVVALGFGVAGYYLKQFGWPRIALVMALVVGPLFEVNFHLSRTLLSVGRIDLWSRPVAFTLLILMIGSLFVSAIRLWSRARADRG